MTQHASQLCWRFLPFSPGRVSNTWATPRLSESLLDGVINEMLNRLPDDTIAFPRHGRDTTLGRRAAVAGRVA